MPFMNVITETECTRAQMNTLKAGVAAILEEVLDKPERGVFVTFSHMDGFYRAGEYTDDSAILDLKYIGEFDLQVKQELTKKLCELFRDELGCDPEKIIVPITEKVSANWGRRFGNYKG